MIQQEKFAAPFYKFLFSPICIKKTVKYNNKSWNITERKMVQRDNTVQSFNMVWEIFILLFLSIDWKLQALDQTEYIVS